MVPRNKTVMVEKDERFEIGCNTINTDYSSSCYIKTPYGKTIRAYYTNDKKENGRITFKSGKNPNSPGAPRRCPIAIIKANEKDIGNWTCTTYTKEDPNSGFTYHNYTTLSADIEVMVNLPPGNISSNSNPISMHVFMYSNCISCIINIVYKNYSS